MFSVTHPTRRASATRPSQHRRASRSRGSDRRAKHRYQFRPVVESLEDRRLLAGVVELVSAAHPDFQSDSLTANGSSSAYDVSADGRYVVFISLATDLVTGMNIAEGKTNVYRFDRETGDVILVSVNSDGTGSGNRSSSEPQISADGSVVVFTSAATDLHPLHWNPEVTSRQIFARRIDCPDGVGVTQLVTVNVGETGPGNSHMYGPTISADGSVVAFTTSASNLHPLDADSKLDIYARRIDWENPTGTTHLVTVNKDGTGTGNGDIAYLKKGNVSADGSVIVFNSYASNLHPLDTDAGQDVFARRINWGNNTGSTHLVSVNAAGTNSGNGTSRISDYTTALSADGSVIAFESDASNLHPLDTNTRWDVFARRIDWETETGTTHLVSVNREGTRGSSSTSYGGHVSADGRVVAFRSYASDLHPVKTEYNEIVDLFARQIDWNTNTGSTHLVTVNMDGTGGRNGSPADFMGTSMSSDGSFIVFRTDASNLHPLKTVTTYSDLLVRDLNAGATYLISMNTDNTGGANDNCSGNRISPDGSVVMFHGDATNLVEGDLNNARDVFLVALQNLPPVALDDGYGVLQNQTLIVEPADGLLANDASPKPDPLCAVLVEGPSHGQLTLAADGSFTYVPDASFSGDVTFTYKAYDGQYYSNEATVTIAVAPVLVTKFYVVNDASADQTYEYSPTGELVESYGLGSGNTAPRGVATTVAGDKTWVVDANRKVYVYDTSGGLLGSWTAGTLSTKAVVEGIATNGTDIWIVDAYSDKVYKYAGAATRLSSSQNAASSFSLNTYNRSPKDMVTDGSSIWVVEDSTTDKVFKYSMSGLLLGSWTISSGGGRPTGITIDPSNASQDIWIVDSQTDRVYQYTGARTRTSGSQSAAATFALAADNGNPQGIADPPPPAVMPALQVAVNPVAAPAPSVLSRSQVDTLEGSFTPPIHVDFAFDLPATRVDSLSTVAPEIEHRFGSGHTLDAPWLMAETLPVGSAEPLPARAVDRLMAALGHRRSEKIGPLEDVLEELINADR